jgi:hypothetical protein
MRADVDSSTSGRDAIVGIGLKLNTSASEP